MTQYLNASALKKDSGKLQVHQYYLEKSKGLFGDKFDYGKTVFSKSDSMIELTCQVHRNAITISQRQHFRTTHGGCNQCHEEIAAKSRVERFLVVAKEVHGYRFDYSLVKDAQKRESLKVQCQEHGAFDVVKEVHLSTSYGGCPECKAFAQQEKKTLTIEEELRAKHGNKFDYSNTNFKAKPFIQITCKRHGEFSTELRLHQRGIFGGCDKCLEEHLTAQAVADFTKQAQERYGNTYSYSAVKKLSKSGKVEIHCNAHGKFEANHRQHLISNYGACWGCKEEQENEKAFTLIKKEKGEDFFNRYSYAKSKFLNGTELTTVTCISHGDFHTCLRRHLQKECGGCEACVLEKQANQQKEKRKLKDETYQIYQNRMLASFKEKHGERFDYSKTVLDTQSIYVDVICRTHGVFCTRRLSHIELEYGGCAGCKVEFERQEKLNKFIAKGVEKHQNRFSYTNITLEEWETGKVTITCSLHGEFKSEVYNHLRYETGMCQGCVEESDRLKRQNKFIEKSKSIHGDAFNYSKVHYTEKDKKVRVKCVKHASFMIAPSQHYTKEFGGCLKCKQENSRELKTTEHINKFIQVHGDKFDYSKVSSTQLTDHIEIGCASHGLFTLTVIGHIRGAVCPKCERLEGYLKRFKAAHGDAFDYSAVTEIEAHFKPIPIRCIKHDHSYMQVAVTHLRSGGCAKCVSEKKAAAFSETALKKLAEHLGDNYDLSNSTYHGRDKNIEVLCRQHGIFSRSYSSILSVKHACFKCANDEIIKTKTQDFIKRCTEIHGDKYDLSKVVVTKNRIPIKVGCKKHGIFEINPESLLDGSGCAQCAYEANSPLKKTREEWIAEFKKVHGDKYGYSLLPEKVYAYKSLKVICPVHSTFITRIDTHLKNGCPKCTQTESKTKHFWMKIKEQYGNRLKYINLVRIESKDQEVTLHCAEHGAFTKTVRNLLRAKESCPTCLYGMNTELLREYIYNRFGDKIITTTVTFRGWTKAVRMHCRVHGSISTTPNDLMKDSFDCSGCKKEQLVLIK